MHGSHHPEALSAVDDLDRVASEYARAWIGSDPARRRRLRDDLICRLVPFADRLAARYRDRAEPLEDLRQVARLGLVNAVDRYDPDRGSFTAFAFATITGEIKRHFRDRTWGVHVHRRLQELSLDVARATAELGQVLGRLPTAPELARHLDVSEADVERARVCAAGHRPVPLSTPLRGDSSGELGDLIGTADDSMEGMADRMAIGDLLRVLPEQVQRMVILRFYGNRTQAQIAAQFGISQMHVSRLLGRALAWLRAAMQSDTVPPWNPAPEKPWNPAPESPGPGAVPVRLRRTATAFHVEVAGAVGGDTAEPAQVIAGLPDHVTPAGSVRSRAAGRDCGAGRVPGRRSGPAVRSPEPASCS